MNFCSSSKKSLTVLSHCFHNLSICCWHIVIFPFRVVSLFSGPGSLRGGGESLPSTWAKRSWPGPNDCNTCDKVGVSSFGGVGWDGEFGCGSDCGPLVWASVSDSVSSDSHCSKAHPSLYPGTSFHVQLGRWPGATRRPTPEATLLDWSAPSQVAHHASPGAWHIMSDASFHTEAHPDRHVPVNAPFKPPRRRTVPRECT